MSIPIVIDCDPGHDDAIAILLALASPEVELRGITTVAGNQTLAKTTRNALKILELAGRTDVPVAAGADRPLVRELQTAPNVHGESGLDGPHKALFTRAHADRLRGTGRAGKAVAELSDFFQRFHESRYGFDGSPIHDALAVAEVIDPTLVTTVTCNVEIETASQYCDGR